VTDNEFQLPGFLSDPTEASVDLIKVRMEDYNSLLDSYGGEEGLQNKFSETIDKIKDYNNFALYGDKLSGKLKVIMDQAMDEQNTWTWEQWNEPGKQAQLDDWLARNQSTVFKEYLTELYFPGQENNSVIKGVIDDMFESTNIHDFYMSQYQQQGIEITNEEQEAQEKQTTFFDVFSGKLAEVGPGIILSVALGGVIGANFDWTKALAALLGGQQGPDMADNFSDIGYQDDNSFFYGDGGTTIYYDPSTGKFSDEPFTDPDTIPDPGANIDFPDLVKDVDTSDTNFENYTGDTGFTGDITSYGDLQASQAADYNQLSAKLGKVAPEISEMEDIKPKKSISAMRNWVRKLPEMPDMVEYLNPQI